MDATWFLEHEIGKKQGNHTVEGVFFLIVILLGNVDIHKRRYVTDK